jgi:hypothetical protein
VLKQLHPHLSSRLIYDEIFRSYRVGKHYYSFNNAIYHSVCYKLLDSKSKLVSFASFCKISKIKEGDFNNIVNVEEYNITLYKRRDVFYKIIEYFSRGKIKYI